MFDLDNENIVDIINKILDDPGELIPNDLLEQLIEALDGCEVICPVKDEELVLYEDAFHKSIPVSFDMDDFKKAFKDESPEIFKFNYLNDFMTSDIDGIVFSPGSRPFRFNKTLSKLVFNRNREKTQTTKGYDVKVRLNYLRPLTWRDIIIPDNITFMELDDILKTLWGFNGHHLSCFLIRKDNMKVMDKQLADETMMGCDYDANTTIISEIFEKYDKITYWYDFGDDWQFDIEIKKKIDYDKDYVTIKRFKGKYDPVEDCQGVYGLSEIIYYAEHPEEEDSSLFCELVEYLYEFDMEFTQLLLQSKVYTQSIWHEDYK